MAQDIIYSPWVRRPIADDYEPVYTGKVAATMAIRDTQGMEARFRRAEDAAARQAIEEGRRQGDQAFKDMQADQWEREQEAKGREERRTQDEVSGLAGLRNFMDAYQQARDDAARKRWANDAERAAEAKRLRARAIMAAASDGLKGLAKLYYLNKGMPYVRENPASTASAWVQQRYHDIEARHRANADAIDKDMARWQDALQDAQVKFGLQQVKGAHQQAIQNALDRRADAANASRERVATARNTANISIQKAKAQQAKDKSDNSVRVARINADARLGAAQLGYKARHEANLIKDDEVHENVRSRNYATDKRAETAKYVADKRASALFSD